MNISQLYVPLLNVRLLGRLLFGENWQNTHGNNLEEFSNRVLIDKLPNFIIKTLAQIYYKPQELQPLPYWRVGSTENNLSEYRYFLKKLWEKLLRKNQEPFEMIVDWYQGIKLAIMSDSEISRCIFVEGLYEPNEFYFLSKFLKSGMTFVDVGAHVGLYSLFASKLVGKKGFVLAIEPSYREFKQLRENLKINELENVKAIRTALADKNSRMKLKIAAKPHDGHNSLGSFGYEVTKIDHIETIRTKTLDELKIKKIDVIKIDIEGAEYLVLKGSRQTLRSSSPIILMELSDRTLNKQGYDSLQILNFLRSLSYSVYNFNSAGFLVRLKQKKYYDGENIVAILKNKSYLTEIML